jgi:hypothetical protein
VTCRVEHLLAFGIPIPRRYTVPFAWVGRVVEVRGTSRHVVVHAEGREIARHVRGSDARLLLDPVHFEGPFTERVQRPTPLVRRALLQITRLSSAARQHLDEVPAPAAVGRPLAEYARLVEALA